MGDRHSAVIGFKRVAGDAGHVSYYVELHTGGGATRHVAFSGNIFVGPVLMSSRNGDGRWDHRMIDDPRQFGEFVSADWVDRFLDSWYEAQAA
jgi:hypothetical protein